MKIITAFLKWFVLSVLAALGLVAILVLCLGDIAMSDLATLRDMCTVKKYDYVILHCDTSANKVEYTFEYSVADVKKELNIIRLYAMGMYRDFGPYEYAQKGQSFSYRTADKGLIERKHLIIELDSISPTQTTVRVRTKFSKVTVEKRIGFQRVEKRIPSNHIIEYSFLFYFGKKLGVKNMPPIVFPEELTRGQIMETYRSFDRDNDCAFTEAELFGGNNSH